MFAVGNPLGLKGTISDGIVSGVRTFEKESIIQISAPISPGSSGGPILNNKGELIGVAVATLTAGQNLNFAIPSKQVNDLLNSSGELVPFKSAKVVKTSFLENLQSKKPTDELIVDNFLWDEFGSNFTYSIRNTLNTDIKNIIVMIIFYDKNDNPIDYYITNDGLYCETEAIPAGLAKRFEGSVHESTKRITTKPITYYGVEMGYRDKPYTKLETRILDFDILQ